MRSGCQAKTADIRVQSEQLPRCGERDSKGPGLIDLFDEVELSILDGMKADRLEFHPAQEIERVARLAANP